MKRSRMESPEKFPESSNSPFSNDDSVNNLGVFFDVILLWLLTTWLIKGVLSEIRGGLLDLEHLWLTNQISELH